MYAESLTYLPETLHLQSKIFIHSDMHILIIKKILTILLLAVAVILTAGSISDVPDEPYIPGEDEDITALYSIIVEKVESDIYPEDKMVISIPSPGYTWEVTESSGLNYEEGFEYTETGGYSQFTISADEPVSYVFSADLLHLQMIGDHKKMAELSQGVVVSEGEGSGDVVLKLIFDSTFNPEPGEAVKIVTAGNPTTGYTWKLLDTPGLTVLKEEYVADESGALGAGRYYEWYVTTGKAGTYTIKAECTKEGSSQVENSFFFNLIFI